MSDQGVPAALSREGLLGKSKVYVLRAFRAKSAGDHDEYQLWSSLALELLGKAALAKIHPSLIVDPNHIDSLLAASGINIGTDIKTITSKTLYARLRQLSKYFDASVQKFCDDISLRRNAELHSGEAPFQQMKLEAWEAKYWHAAQIILDVLHSSLDEWLGADQARTPKEHAEHAKLASKQAAVERVRQASENFANRHKKERENALAESKAKDWYHYPTGFIRLLADHKWLGQCPACTGQALLAGMKYHEEVLESDPNSGEEEVETLYSAEELHCPVCDLRLDSREEIEAVGLDADHQETESRERSYEPDYGNC